VSASRPDRILIVKLGALGDVVMSLAAVKRIRAAHPDAKITVLTTAPFAPVFEACPWVDKVETDGRPKGLGAFLKLAARLRRARYRRVYDLQTSDRSTALWWMLPPFPPEWSGIARFGSHPHRNPRRDFLHPLEQQAEQLNDAGLTPLVPTELGAAPLPDLGFALGSDHPERRPEAFGLHAPYALLVPGGSAHRPEKRWPIERWALLAERLKAEGLTPVVLGGAQETELAQQIPAAVSLAGRTDLLQLAGLGASAALAVGNDTGPTHVLASAGAPTLVLFSGASDPLLSSPRGRRVEVLRREQLSDLSVESVLATLEDLRRSA
jgi:ADP-heptose:LPS heptosyltransferase